VDQPNPQIHQQTYGFQAGPKGCSAQAGRDAGLGVGRWIGGQPSFRLKVVRRPHRELQTLHSAWRKHPVGGVMDWDTPLPEVQGGGKGGKNAVRAGVVEGYDVPATAECPLHIRSAAQQWGYWYVVGPLSLMATPKVG